MALKWMKVEAKDGEGEDHPPFEIKPETIKKAIEPELTDIKTSMQAMTEFIKEQQKEKREAKEAADAAAAAETARKNNERQDDPTNWLDDPRGAVLNEMRPLVEAQLRTNARLAKVDTLGELEYYSDPTIKSKVDELIAKQPLKSQSDPAIILNAYKVTVFDHEADIKAGKIKSKLSGGDTGGRGTGGHSGTDERSTDNTLNDTEKAYIRKLGVSEAAYIKQRNDMEFV